FHGFDRLLAVEHDGLAVGFDLAAAPRPQIRIGEGRRIAEGMAERLADRAAHGLELLARFAQRLPGLRKLAVRISELLEPGFAVGDLQPDDAPRHRDPALAVVSHDLRGLVEAALRLAERLGDVAHVGETLAVELRPIVEHADDVRPGARLNRGGDARLNVVGVDRLDRELHAERLLALRRDLALEQLVRGGAEIRPGQPMDARRLRAGGRAARGENARHPGRGGYGAAAGQFQETSAIEPSHDFLPCGGFYELIFRSFGDKRCGWNEGLLTPPGIPCRLDQAWIFLVPSFAHFTASSAGIPWAALAYMSTMMYLLSTSAALRSAGPA